MSEPALVLDCRGMPCPRPVIELARHVGDIEVGEVVGVASDDAAARVDVPAWCRMRGHEYLGEHLGETAAADGVPIYLVRRLR